MLFNQTSNMFGKFNEATPQRLGDHLLDAPAVQADLSALRNQLLAEPSWQDSDRNAITLFKTDGLSLVLTVLHEGAKMEENILDSRIVIQVLMGHVQVKTSVQSHDLAQGEVLVLHEGIPHSLSALTDSTVLFTVAR